MSARISPSVVSGETVPDARARDHRVLDVAVREVEDAVDEHRELLRQVAGLTRIGDDAFEVFRRRRRVDVVHRFDAEEPEQGVGGDIEHRDEPAEDGEVDGGRARERPGERLGVRDRQVLRVQLTEDHLHDRRDDEREHGAHRDAHGRGNTGALEEHAQ
jgi:hypothetical protein